MRRQWLLEARQISSRLVGAFSWPTRARTLPLLPQGLFLKDFYDYNQGWQGRGVARVAGCQNVATPAGSRVAKN